MAHAQEGADEAGGCESLPTIDARKSPSGRHCRGCRSKSLSARSTIFLYHVALLLALALSPPHSSTARRCSSNASKARTEPRVRSSLRWAWRESLTVSA